MAEPINIDGVLYEPVGNGQMRVVGYASAPAASQGRIFTLPPNPEKVRQEGRQNAAESRAAANQRRQEEKDARAELEWNATHNPDGSPKKSAAGAKQLPDGAAKRYEESINAFASLDRAVSGFQDAYAGNTVTGGLENTLQSRLGTGTPGQAQWWADFAATDNAIRNAIFGASLTAGEKAAYEATSIKPNMDPAQVRANLQRRMELARDTLGRKTNFLKANGYNPDAIDALAGEYGDLLAGKAEQRADNEVPDPATGADLKPPADMRSDPRMEAASGDTREELDPRATSQIDSLMNAGASLATVNAVLKRSGHPGISPGSFRSAQQWIKANPGKQYFGSNITKTVPLTTMQSLSGSPLGAGAARFANSATAGMVGAMAGDKGQGALDAMAAANPRSAMAGDIAGGVLGAFGAEAGAAASLGGRGAAWLAPRIADVGFGALSGFNAAQEGEGGMGALTGAAAGLTGGFLGDRAARAAGSAFRGVQNPAARYLRDHGVPLTVGQTVGDSGRIGAGIRNVENALTSVPGVNGVVNARYREGLEGFNSAMMRELPGHSGETGAAGVAEAGGLVDDAYRFLDNTNLPIDAPFAGSQAAVRADLPALPSFGREVGAGMDAIDASASRMGGTLPGREWQSAVSNTRADRSSIAGQPFARPAVGALNDVEGNLMGLAQRQGPPGTIEDLDAANLLHGRYQTILRALDNGPAQQADELATPARLDAASRQGANAFGGRAASIAGDRPFYDLTTAGRAALPSTVPDSGTATRGIVAASLLGGLGGSAAGGIAGEPGTGAGAGLGAALLLAAGGSRQGQRALTSILMDRPDLAINVGNALTRNARIGGWSGAGVLTPLTVGQ